MHKTYDETTSCIRQMKEPCHTSDRRQASVHMQLKTSCQRHFLPTRAISIQLRLHMQGPMLGQTCIWLKDTHAYRSEQLIYDTALQYVHVWYNCTVLWVTVKHPPKKNDQTPKVIFHLFFRFLGGCFCESQLFFIQFLLFKSTSLR